MGTPKKRKLLSSTRPSHRSRLPSSTSTSSSTNTSNLSSKTTRTLIRTHHTLHKRLAAAERAGDVDSASGLRDAIAAAGGLAAYQRASIQGQSAERGGDSSKVLVGWFREGNSKSAAPVSTGPVSAAAAAPPPRLRLLEVGALRPDNACATSGLFDVTRIDLNSQHASILSQDFMERPVPVGPDGRVAEGFDVISLSLVVNYVPDAEGRGDMLRRTTEFLRMRGEEVAGDGVERGGDEGGGDGNMTPGLFLVLPAPCVLNSRYMTDERLVAILKALGYDLVKTKTTKKLVYYYFHFEERPSEAATRFPKELLRDGKSMNNFSIVLK